MCGWKSVDNFTPIEKSTFEKLLKAFDLYFLPKKVIPMETFKFNNLNQDEDQPIEQYLTVLRKQAKLCDFTCKGENCNASFEERMIRDRLIVGINDKQIQARLIREADIDVDKIVDYCKAVSLSKEHFKTLNPDCEVNAVKNMNIEKKPFNCRRCLQQHLPSQCPAFRKTCAVCQKQGHFARACFRNRDNGNQDNIRREQNRASGSREKQYQSKEERNVRAVEYESEEEEHEVYINECKINNRSEAWYETLTVQGKNVKFKLDSGAEISILPLNIYNTLNLKKDIQAFSATLISYGNFKFQTLGQIKLECQYRNVKDLVNFVIVDFKADPLLGLRDCLKFKMIKKVDSINILPKTRDDMYETYKQVFKGLGKIPGIVKIELQVIQCNRKIPFSLHEPLKKTLDNLENKGIIKKVDHPTDWVNSLIVVEKPNKSLRLCIDPKPLNKYIKREIYNIPTGNDIISRLTGKKIFSVIDMKDGFWQLELDESSSELTTFNTPFGRYCFARLPFGVSNAPEIFQKKNHEIFGDIEGVDIYFDDLIISGDDEKSHDIALKKVLERAIEYNVKFNFDKFQYKLREVHFMGQIISENGVKPDGGNIEAVRKIESPKNKVEVLRILGLLKFFSKFIPNLSQLTSNMRELTKKQVPFSWTQKHEDELNLLKTLVLNSPCLQIFNPSESIVIQCDASSEGLGACLLQSGRPVAFASKSLSNAQKKYAQIEKELAAVEFALKKFHFYCYGYSVTIQTDHKPLIPIFAKNLEKVSARLQRMLLNLLKYDLRIVYLPGKEMFVADLLSRSFDRTDIPEDDPEMNFIVHTVYNNLPMSDNRKAEFKNAINNDPILSKIKFYCENEWPKSDKNLPEEVKFYYRLKEQIYLSNDILFLGYKTIVPTALREEMLKLIHSSHFGIVKTKLRARQLFYWPRINRDIEHYIAKCENCQINQKANQKEPLISHTVPTRPWQYIYSDFFEFNNKNFLLLVDSYSNWIECTQTNTKTANDVIKFCKGKFCQFGIPEIFFADNVPYNSEHFKKFAKEWNLELVFSSPHHHQSNSYAEKSVHILKSMLKKCNSQISLLPELILEYNNTPLPSMGLSPSQMFLNRLAKTKIPISSKNLEQLYYDPKIVHSKIKQKLEVQKHFYDRTAKSLTTLDIGDDVLILEGNEWVKGKVKEIINARSYLVTDIFGNTLRRNRKLLKVFKTDNRQPENETIISSSHSSLLYEYNFGSNQNDSALTPAIERLPETENYIENSFETADNNSSLSSLVESLPEANRADHDHESSDSQAENENSELATNKKRMIKLPTYLNDYVSDFESSTSSSD